MTGKARTIELVLRDSDAHATQMRNGTAGTMSNALLSANQLTQNQTDWCRLTPQTNVSPKELQVVASVRADPEKTLLEESVNHEPRRSWWSGLFGALEDAFQLGDGVGPVLKDS